MKAIISRGTGHMRNARTSRSGVITLRGLLRLALGPVMLLAAAGAHAQAVRVIAANSSNSSIYEVNFSGSGGTITRLNTDQSVHVSLRSLVLVPNVTTGQIDLLVADAARGTILRYAGATGVAEVIWSPSNGVATPSEGAGPLHPDGLSVDSDGNLFVLSSAPGSSTPPDVWVLPHSASGPLPDSFGLPRLVDGDFGGMPVQLLEESLVARSPTGMTAGGDLLVLASDPATVFLYRAADVRRVLQGMGEINPTVLIPATRFPTNAQPGGMDFWPLDNSLLITTGDGRILRFASATTQLPDFASQLGNGKFKVKTGREHGVALAVVADNNGGDILKFGAPPPTGPNPPLAIVTSGVQSPQGLTVSSIASVAASSCLESAGGCDILGRVLKHDVRAPTALGAVIEEPCIVQTDPRIAQFGTCTGHTLVASNVCAGLPDVVIPDSLCGSSGTTGAGFALINTTTTTALNDQTDLVVNEAFSNDVLPDPFNPNCPTTVIGWAPKPGEGSVPEGNVLLDVTGGCGSSIGISRGLSIWAVGLALNEEALPGADTTTKLVNYSAIKYDALLQTISSATIDDKLRRKLLNCIANSRSKFDRGRFPDAVTGLLACDSLAVQNRSAFTGSTLNPNPFGDVRGRIANLYLTINTRLLGNPANSTWPPGG